TIFLELRFIPGAVVAVPGKPVKFPDNDHIKQLFIAVFNHILKFRPVIRLGGNSPVDIVPQDCDPVPFSKGGTLPDLSFNSCFSLIIGRISGVNHSFHCPSPPAYTSCSNSFISPTSL